MLGWSKDRRDEEFLRFSWASAFKHHNPLTAQIFRPSRGSHARLARVTLVNAMDTVLACVRFYVIAKHVGPTGLALVELVDAATLTCEEQKRAITPTV